MLNNYMWQTYLKAGGSEIVNLFLKNLTEQLTIEYIETVGKLRCFYYPESVAIKDMTQSLQHLSEDLAKNFGLLESGEYTIDSALQFVYNELQGDVDLSAQDKFAHFSDNIEYYTTFLSCELPELFVPYYFKYNFNILEKIAKEFGINIPAIPAKKDYDGRFFYYARLCESLLDFREKNDLTPYELCAFLYDFAPKYIGGIDSYIIKEPPNPKSAFLIGGTKDDYFLSDDVESISLWQCNPETRAGDMIVMYLKSPISAIVSVWRSVSVGFVDPFFYYYRCTYISKPTKISRITQRELIEDTILGALPIVRKNMQGLNGVELPPSAYNHLIEKANGNMPLLEYFAQGDTGSLSREKDVEDQLIKPFLSELGYSTEEYVQQLYIEIGNHNHALIPDFVIHPVVTSGHQFADFLIEAKFSIPSGKQLEEAKKQARSYANLLHAKYSVVAAKEGIWITSKKDDYSGDILSFSWSEMKIADNFHKVMALLGKNKI